MKIHWIVKLVAAIVATPAYAGSFFDTKEDGTSPVSSTSQTISDSMANRILPFSQMSGASYADIWKNGEYGKPGSVEGWQRGGTSNAPVIHEASGFSVTVFRRDKDFVIAFRGSNKLNDFAGANLQQAIYGPKLAGQYQAGLDVTKRLEADIREELKKEGHTGPINISLTGHSLGGGIAQYVATKNPQLNAVIFNGAGLQGLQYDRGKYYNIANINSIQDVVHKIPGTKQVGQEYTFDPMNKKSNLSINNPISNPSYNHSIDRVTEALQSKSERYAKSQEIAKTLPDLKSLGRQLSSSLPFLIPSTLLSPNSGSTAALSPNAQRQIDSAKRFGPEPVSQSAAPNKNTFNTPATAAQKTTPLKSSLQSNLPKLPSALAQGKSFSPKTLTGEQLANSKSQSSVPVSKLSQSANPKVLQQSVQRTASFQVQRPYAPKPQPTLRPATSQNIAEPQRRVQFGQGVHRPTQNVQSPAVGLRQPTTNQARQSGAGLTSARPSAYHQQQAARPIYRAPTIRSSPPAYRPPVYRPPVYVPQQVYRAPVFRQTYQPSFNFRRR